MAQQHSAHTIEERGMAAGIAIIATLVITAIFVGAIVIRSF